MSSLTGKILNLIKPAVTDSVLQTIADLASNFQAIDDGHSAHLADKAPHPNIPAVRVYHSLNQSIPAGVGTLLAFDSVRFDTDGMWDSSDNTKLVCQTSGKYIIISSAMFAPNSTGNRAVSILLNGTTTLATTEVSNTGTSGTKICATTLYDLQVGDYVQLAAYQSNESGSSLEIVANPQRSPEFMMVRVG